MSKKTNPAPTLRSSAAVIRNFRITAEAGKSLQDRLYENDFDKQIKTMGKKGGKA